jgi:hypothetical protein
MGLRGFEPGNAAHKILFDFPFTLQVFSSTLNRSTWVVSQLQNAYKDPAFNRLLRNSPNAIIFWRFEAAGAKALAHFAPLTARLKPCPCYKTQFQQSFVTACKGPALKPALTQFRPEVL